LQLRFVGCHKKWTFHFFQCAGGHHSNFEIKVWDLKEWPYPWFHQFSWRACIYCIFWTFGCLNSNLNYGYIKYTSNSSEENTWRCVNPETMHVSYLGAPSTFGTLSTHRRLVICLRCCRSLPKKIQKWQK
jgi:hypothetical protein